MTIDEEETRSISSKQETKIESLPLANFSTTNNIFENFGSSSLLVDAECKPSGLFAQGDRFIPCRHEETTSFEGQQKFRHEENLILFGQQERQEREARKERRRNNQDGNESDNSSRSSSSEDSNMSTGSDAEGEQRGSRGQRRQRQLYNNLL